MSLQTEQPIQRMNLATSYRMAREVVRHFVSEVGMDLDPPYQRGHVWTPIQRINLIRSLLMGIPTGVVILSNRSTDRWQQDADTMYAVIDGKQRLTTMLHWYANRFAVPRSWFPSEHVTPGPSRRLEEGGEHLATHLDPQVPLEDGEYIYYGDLTLAGRRIFNNGVFMQVAEYSSRDVDEEAELYRLVNTAGTPHTDL